MARIQRIESDSSYSSAPVRAGQILTYKIIRDGQVVYRAKLPGDQGTVDIGTAGQIAQAMRNAVTYYSQLPLPTTQNLGKVIVYTGNSNYYSKGHTYICISVGQTYQWLDVSPVVSLPELDVGAYIQFQNNEVEEDGTITFQLFRAPTGILTASGKYYPVQKSFVTMHYPQSDSDVGFVKLELAPYLAYQNIPLANGIGDTPWFCLFTGGSKTDGQLQLNNYYTKSRVDSLLNSKVASPTNTYSSGYALHINSAGSTYWKNIKDYIPIDSYWNSDKTSQQISKYVSSKLTSYYTSQYINSNYVSSVALDSYYSVGDSRLNAPIDSAVSMLKTSLAGSYFTKSQGSGFVTSVIGNSVTAAISQYVSQNTYLIPKQGSSGYVLTKTSSGVQWASTQQAHDDTYYDARYVAKPAQQGSAGDVLTKTAAGTSWTSITVSTLPSGGSSGDVLTKTANGETWSDISTGILGSVSASYMQSATNAGSTGNVLYKTAEGTSWGPAAQVNQTWYAINCSGLTSITLDRANGEFQSVVSQTGDLTITSTISNFGSHIDLILYVPYTNYVTSIAGTVSQAYSSTALLATWVKLGNTIKRLNTIQP